MKSSREIKEYREHLKYQAILVQQMLDQKHPLFDCLLYTDSLSLTEIKRAIAINYSEGKL